ncbi:polyketide synthase [Fusarium mexicanum]|uniref:Polyketide synthase n=1 Tax=Fusarium mexicanum TaxID=751941 RepID=A0A8H5I6S0_9HYPO|nr:polyketide synthase [Fusarium mexicanum]
MKQNPTAANMDLSGLVRRVCWEPAALSKQVLAFDTVEFLVPRHDENYYKLLFSAYQEQVVSEGYATAVLACISDVESFLSSHTIFVHIPSIPKTKHSVHLAVSKSCYRLIEAAQLLQPRQRSGPASAYKLFSLSISGDSISGLVTAPLFGLGRVIKSEVPDIFRGVFETDKRVFPTAAIRYARGFNIVRIYYRTAQTDLLEPFLDKPAVSALSPLQLSTEGKYLVTSRTLGMGLEIATWFGYRGARNLVLVSRRGHPSSQGSTEQHGDDEKFLLRIKDLETLGVTVHVLAIDVSKSSAASEIRLDIDHLALPPVKGVVHAAGIAGYHTLERCSSSDMAEVLAPNVIGALALDSLFPSGSLDFLDLICSIGQLVGFEGQLCYAPANAFIDRLAEHRSRQRDNTSSMLWSCWRGVGLNAQNKSSMRMISRGMQDRGLSDISQDEAFEAWDYISSLKTDHAVIVRAIELDANKPPRHPILRSTVPRQQSWSECPEHAVAVVGFACQTAAGETAKDLWQVLLEGKSMVREVSPERFPEAASMKLKTRLWANLMSDVDSFDHQFFKTTKRKAAALDPHQRLLLQTTYHALESAGWLSDNSPEGNNDCKEGQGHTTGCFFRNERTRLAAQLGQ